MKLSSFWVISVISFSRIGTASAALSAGGLRGVRALHAAQWPLSLLQQRGGSENQLTLILFPDHPHPAIHPLTHLIPR